MKIKPAGHGTGSTRTGKGVSVDFLHQKKPWIQGSDTPSVLPPLLFGFLSDDALGFVVYSRSQKVGNPIASILKSNVWGIPALFGLNPVSNFMGITVGV